MPNQDYRPHTPRRWLYSGDINIEYGGVFYCLDSFEHDYVDAVRVTPCSDVGAAENCFWIERLTVNIPTDAERMRSVLNTCGYTFEDLQGEHGQHLIVDACIAHGSFDQEFSECIQIGVKQSEFGEPIQVDKVLRGNTSLRNYARRVARQVN